MRPPILTRLEGALADPRRRAMVGTGAAAALLVGVLSFAWPDRDASARRDTAYPLTVGDETTAAAGAPGALASAYGDGLGGPFQLAAVGGRPSGVPGRPCTPRREAIETLGSQESGYAPEAAVALVPLEALPLERSELTLAELAPGLPFLPGGGGPPSVLPGVDVGTPPPVIGPPPGPGPVTPPPPIPEPETWALMTLGLGILGAALRRRRVGDRRRLHD